MATGIRMDAMVYRYLEPICALDRVSRVSQKLQ